MDNESETLAKHISCECSCELEGRKCHSRQKWNKDYVWNVKIISRIHIYVLVSVIKIVRLVNTLKTEYMKSLIDDLVVTCDETVDTPESESINVCNKINY